MRARVTVLCLFASGCMVARSGLGGGDADAAVSDLAFDTSPPDANADLSPVDLGPPDLGCPPGWIDLDHAEGNGCEYMCDATGAETCNGLDDDCDGMVDGPGTPGWTTFYRDADGDGHGSATTTTTGCVPLAGYLMAGDDCNDGDPMVYPGAPEFCDARDQNCDGIADETASCGICIVAVHGTHTYLFCNDTHSFNYSDGVCAGFGYHLATIQDETEDTYVASTARAIRATGWWIGYTEMGAAYHWIAGTSTYTGWAPGEPTHGTEHCALEAWTGGAAHSWNDGDCDEYYPFICETPP